MKFGKWGWLDRHQEKSFENRKNLIVNKFKVVTQLNSQQIIDSIESERAWSFDASNILLNYLNNFYHLTEPSPDHFDCHLFTIL